MACLGGVNLTEVFLQSAYSDSIVIPPIRYGLRVSEVSTPVILPSVAAA
jgi:hypothetical protein